jgi:very-short-patch-repair endonuclease
LSRHTRAAKIEAVSEDLQSASTPRPEPAERRLVQLAERQWGVVTRAQLASAAVSGGMVTRWVRRGRLHRIYHGVYAVGHRVLRVEGRLAAALLYAGPGAALSHTTGAWWWALRKAATRVIHVTSPRRCRSPEGVHVHGPAEVERVTHDGLPVTTVERTLLDISPLLPFDDLRRAIAEAEYRGLLDMAAFEGFRRRKGHAALRKALDHHQPQLAETRSELEERFLLLCEDHRLPLPQTNVLVEGFLVDAVWKDGAVIAELDGHAAHARPSAIEGDRRRELVLRAAGYLVVRYTWCQIVDDPESVTADLSAALARPTIRASRRGGRVAEGTRLLSE